MPDSLNTEDYGLAEGYRHFARETHPSVPPCALAKARRHDNAQTNAKAPSECDSRIAVMPQDGNRLALERIEKTVFAQARSLRSGCLSSCRVDAPANARHNVVQAYWNRSLGT